MADFTGYNVKTACSLSLYKVKDRAIFKAARKKGSVILISKDGDFSDLINSLDPHLNLSI